MTTIAACDEYEGQSVVSITSYGAICVEPAISQGEFVFTLPSVGTWFKNNWYVLFIVALVVALVIVGIALQSVRWYRRLKHRHVREVRDKRVDGMLRMVGSSFRLASSSSMRRARGNEVSAKSTTSTSSSSGENDEEEEENDGVMSVRKSPEQSEVGEVDTADSSSHRHRHRQRRDRDDASL